MFDFNCTNDTASKNICRGCLKMSDDVRVMSVDEKNAYQQLLKFQESNINSSLHVCSFCGYLMKKLSKFVRQCHEANKIISSFMEKGTNSQIYLSPLLLSHNLTVSPPQTLDVLEKDEVYETPLFEDDTMFDDDDVPLVMLKKESEEVGWGTKKKKKKYKESDVEENQETADTVIKTELTNPEDTPEPTCETKVQCKRKPKKEVREGFSSRMVQETVEYVVIKLSKEQVLQEMEMRSRSDEYQRTLFKCRACVKGFNFEDVLRTHMEKHSMENGSLQCDICTQYCPSVVSLRGHMKSHTTRYKCKVCGCVRQSRQHLLEHHATAHTRHALRYACHQCDFSTTKRTSMQRHVKTHAAAERHACHQCGKLFKSLETLRVHTMRHDKSKRLQCDTCGRVFIYPSLLHRHVQAVHVRKDYYCVECDREFKSRENLRLHFKKAKKHRDASSYQFECPQCSERFVSASTLSTHVTSAHGEQKRHACVLCRRLYSSRDALRAHARTKHAAACDTTCEHKSVLTAHVRDLTPDHDPHEHCKKLEDNIMSEVSQTISMEH